MGGPGGVLSETRPLRRHVTVLNGRDQGGEVQEKEFHTEKTVRAFWLGLGFSWSYSRREGVHHWSVILKGTVCLVRLG